MKIILTRGIDPITVSCYSKGCSDRSRGYYQTCSTRVVESIDARFYEDAENNNKLFYKRCFYTTSNCTSTNYCKKNNDLLYRYQMSRQPLVNQEILVQAVVELAFVNPLRRYQQERRSVISDDYEVFLYG